MSVAQKLYEGKELGQFGHVGLITYMRTDSTRVSDEAIAEVRQYITGRYGEDIIPEKPNVYRAKKSAQEAHEAIRPTSTEFDPEKIRTHLSAEEYNLYKMIFERFVASQMKPALFDVTEVDVRVDPTDPALTLRASGEVLRFAGFLSVFKDVADSEDDAAANDKALPAMSEGERLDLLDLDTKQNFTQPPPRFTEATLVKALEENGIGRPSTYGSILTTIQTRDYTVKEDGKFKPTALGSTVIKLLCHSFGDIIDETYTARMEEELDEIAEGNLDWVEALREFSGKFNKDLAKARDEMEHVKAGIETEQKCENCGSPMVIKFGRFGEFLACSNYPACKTTREVEAPGSSSEQADEEQIDCEKCGKPMKMKRSRFGQFYACTGYPDCRNTKDPKLLKAGIGNEPQPPCENCGKEMVLRSGRYGPFFSCSGYPDCKNTKRVAKEWYQAPPSPEGAAPPAADSE